MFAIALTQYRQALEERSVLDFSDVLQRALDLLRQMDEFSQSRFRLESRYHHVLVDEFQDTSRAQWELVSLLIQSWGEGLGLATRPSIFIVGDRKQSIYRFRDADVAVLREAGRYIEALRPAGSPHRSISRSFRAVPELLEFINELFAEMSQSGRAARRFHLHGVGSISGPDARWPEAGATTAASRPVLGLAVAEDAVACAAAVAAEIERILREETSATGRRACRVRRGPATSRSCSDRAPAIASSSTSSKCAGIPTYVYKGLGFFDADEIKDLVGADALPRGSRIQPAGGGVPALPLHPHLGSRPGAAGPAPGRARSPIPSCPALRRRSTTRIAACSCTSAGA